MLLIHMVTPKPLSEHLQHSPTMTTFKKLHTALFKREYADCLAEGMAEDWKPTALAGVSTVNLRNSKRWPLGQHSASWSSGSVSVQCLWGQRPHSMEEGTPVRLTVSVRVRRCGLVVVGKTQVAGCTGSEASSEPTSGKAGLAGSCLPTTESKGDSLGTTRVPGCSAWCACVGLGQRKVHSSSNLTHDPRWGIITALEAGTNIYLLFTWNTSLKHTSYTLES